MEEKSRRKKAEEIALMHSKARIHAKISQNDMAMELGVSPKTVQNWEKGISCPDLLQSKEWFRICGINPLRSYLELFYPDQFENLSPTDDDDKIEEALNKAIDLLPMSDKRALLFTLNGAHGASPHSVLQMVLAYLHSPSQIRLSQAVNIYYMYCMVNEMNLHTCPENIMPDTEILRDSIRRTRAAIVNHLQDEDIV